MVEIVPIPVAFIDTEYRFVFANAAVADQVSVPLEELPGTTLEEVVPNFWPQLEQIMQRVIGGETIHNIDLDLRELSPTSRWWIGNFSPVRSNGEVIGVAATSFDVTALREMGQELEARNVLYAMIARANAAMVASENKYELFEEICQLAVETGHFTFAWIGEPRGGLLEPVASCGDDRGYLRAVDESGRQITTDPADARSHGPTGRAFREATVSVVNDYFNSTMTEPWHDLAQQAGFASAAAFPIRQDGGVAAVLTLYSADKNYFTEELVETLSEIVPTISVWMDWYALELERNETEAELLLRDRALTAATQGIVITDAQAGDNPVIFVTPAFEQLTGYPREELIGRNCRFLQGPGTDPHARAEIATAIAEGRSVDVEILNYRKNGEQFWNHLALSPVRDEDGVLTHFVGVQTDVTERRELEERARQAQKMEAIGQLAGGVAHDFNNALTAIRAAADIALEDARIAEVREHLEQIDSAAEHATQLTQQLLAFSRQQVLRPKPTDLNSVVVETTGMITRVIGENIELRQELAEGLDAVVVDRAQLQQVLLNLSINARDAMPDGGTLSISTSERELGERDVARALVSEPGRYLVLEVADTGTGMDETARAKAFEPFFTTKSDGTGLGLATVYGIVHQSGGQIALHTKQGEGTRFEIFLPTTTASAPVELPDRGRAAAALDGDETILHVEDSEMLRPIVATAFKRHGYTVLSASGATEAQQLAEEHSGEIDLMVTDVMMPGLNGRELAELLTAKYPDLKVLFTSGYPADMVLREGIAEAEFNFIEKPFVARELVKVVRELLDS